MMILSQDGMVAVNSYNVVMFEVKESETLPRETRLCVTILVTNGARFSRSIGTFRSPDRTELAKLALDYISFSIGSGHKGSAQVPTEDEMRNIQGAKSRADAARRGKLDDIIKELLKEDHSHRCCRVLCVHAFWRIRPYSTPKENNQHNQSIDAGDEPEYPRRNRAERAGQRKRSLHIVD